MAPSYDCVASSLLCPEDNNSIMSFGDDGVGEGFEGNGESHVNDKEQSFWGDSLMGFPLQSEEWLGSMMERECQFLPREDYVERLQSGALDLSARRDAVDWIGKVGDSKFIFEARTIQRMELLVLSTLKWRMQTITPFSFIDCFLERINDGKLPPRSSISQSIELIVNTIKGIEFLEFRPSEIALAVAISVLGEAQRPQTVDVGKAISCGVHVEKERVLNCLVVCLFDCVSVWHLGVAADLIKEAMLTQLLKSWEGNIEIIGRGEWFGGDPLGGLRLSSGEKEKGKGAGDEMMGGRIVLIFFLIHHYHTN
ncbi:hypothetical protein ACLOJK_013549 [Asimina triloba]